MIVAFAATAVLVAVYSRWTGNPTGASRVLRGTFSAFSLPLLCFTVVGATFGEGGIGRNLRALAFVGAPKSSGARAAVVTAMAACALVSSVVALAVCVIGHGADDPPILQDAVHTFGIGALGGAAYGGYFSLGSAAWLRGVLLALDWIAAAGAGVGALVTPRGHVVALLGGSRCAELSPRVSSIALVILAMSCGLAGALLARRARSA
jgi:hypothetical protein